MELGSNTVFTRMAEIPSTLLISAVDLTAFRMSTPKKMAVVLIHWLPPPLEFYIDKSSLDITELGEP